MDWSKITKSLLKALCVLGVVFGVRLICLEVSPIAALLVIVVLHGGINYVTRKD